MSVSSILGFKPKQDLRCISVRVGDNQIFDECTIEEKYIMKQKTRFSALTAGAMATSLLLGAGTAQAANGGVILDGDTVIRIENLEVFDDVGGVTVYDVDFRFITGFNLYGQNLDGFPFGDANAEEDAFAAMIAINDALGENIPVPGSAGVPSQAIYYIGVEEEQEAGAGLIAAVGSENLTGDFWDPCTRANDCITGAAVLQADQTFTYADLTEDSGEPPPTGVDLTGTVEDAGGTPLCALALASGQFMFTCNPNGPYSLLDLPTEGDGTVKRQVYVDGFFPNVEVLSGSVDETVVMTRAGNCPDYNSFPQPGVFPDSAGKRIDVSGTVLQQNTATPVCAMALANGQFGFTCDGTGNYAANIPLDANGQYKLQVYADGFAPMVQLFDEFSPDNDVRLARASECQ